MSAIDFISRTKTLLRKLHEQGFKLARLRFVFKQCFAVHFGHLTKYGEPLSDLCHFCFRLSNLWRSLFDCVQYVCDCTYVKTHTAWGDAQMHDVCGVGLK